MKRIIFALATAAALTACGPSGGGATNEAADQTTTGACALVTTPDAIFGATPNAVPANDLPGATGSCAFSSADGLKSGDLIVYTTASLGSVTPDAQIATLTGRWTENGVTPTAVEGLGDSAQIAVGLPGDQTQIVLKKGDNLATVVATSGDPALTSEQLARDIAAQVAAAL